MKSWVLLSLLLAVGCVRGAPVDQGVEQGSCEDASAKGAADQALKKINQDRSEGYIFSLHRLSNVHLAKHGETGVVFYLTLDVVETNCSVLSRKDSKDCVARPTENTPVYGQCKATIYINKVNRVVRLYKYNCVVRPVPAARVNGVCPDCPVLTDGDSEQVKKAVTLSLEKFNKESTLSKRFAVIKVERATAGMAMSMYYNAEYTIQETTCAQNADPAEKCPLLECEFAHKGFCKASLFNSPSGDPEVSVECEIYEPEAAEREKKLHASSDHSHSHGSHNHDHGHDHGHGHGHGHGHDHKHDHLHDHEHHHDHAHETAAQHKPEGMVRTLPSMDQPMTLPAFPDVPAGGPVDGVTLPLKPDPQIPDMTEPTIQAFPTTASAQCTAPPKGEQLVEKLFEEDPMFKAAA